MLFDNIQGQALLLVSALTDMIGLLMFFSVLFVSILVTWKLLNLLNNQNSCRSTNGHITISIAWLVCYMSIRYRIISQSRWLHTRTYLTYLLRRFSYAVHVL